MINAEQSNQNQIQINIDQLNNSRQYEQNDLSDLIDQNNFNSLNSIANSNTSHLNISKRIDIDQKNLLKEKDANEQDLCDSYYINIDGVNKRRALFSQDMDLQHKNKQMDASEMSYNQGENLAKTHQKRKSHTINNIDLNERSNIRIKNFTQIQQELNLSPFLNKNNSPISSRNKKASNSLLQAEQNYETSTQDFKYLDFSERLRGSNRMQSIQLDQFSLDSSSQTKVQSSLRNNLSSAYTPRGKAKKSFNLSKNKHRQSAFHLQNEKNNEEIQKTKNYFVIISLVQRFIKSCILRIAYKDFNLLDIQHLKMIGDISYFLKKKIQNNQQLKKKHNQKLDQVLQENRFDVIAKRRENLISFISTPLQMSYIKYCLTKLRKIFIDCRLLSKILNKKTILPNSLYVIIWDFFIVLIMLFHLIIIPVQVCFYLDMNDHISFTVMYIIPAICFTFDLLVMFNTGIYEFGVIVMEQKLISRACWKNKFPYHICLLSALLINFKYQNITIELFTIILRLNQFLQRMNKINQHFQITFKLPKISELFKLMALVLFVAHLCGCGFHYIGQESYSRLDQDATWIFQQKIENESWVHRYIYSAYFAIVTMVTIGYGDIYPKNIYERLYVIFMTLFSCGIFAYAINTIGNIFLEQNHKQKAFQQKLFDIQKYLQSKSINKEAQIRVFKYLEYLNEQSDEVLTKGQAILSECSQDLKEEILKDYYGKILLNLKILQNNFSTEFIQALSIKMKEKRFGPGEVIIQQGNRSKNLYFLSNGDIEYYIQNGQKNKQILALQNIFRVFDFRLFITEKISPYSIRSTLNTTMAYLTFEDFILTLQEFNADYVRCSYLQFFFLQILNPQQSNTSQNQTLKQ